MSIIYVFIQKFEMGLSMKIVMNKTIAFRNSDSTMPPFSWSFKKVVYILTLFHPYFHQEMISMRYQDLQRYSPHLPSVLKNYQVFLYYFVSSNSQVKRIFKLDILAAITDEDTDNHVLANLPTGEFK